MPNPEKQIKFGCHILDFADSVGGFSGIVHLARNFPMKPDSMWLSTASDPRFDIHLGFHGASNQNAHIHATAHATGFGVSDLQEAG